MKRRVLAIVLTMMMVVTLIPCMAFAASDGNNGDWSSQNVVLKNTSEAEMMVRVGDIDACNDEYAVDENGYNPFSAKDQYPHGYAWLKDSSDPAGTDRIFVGSRWSGESYDGYSSCFSDYHNGADTENAYGDGALKLTMNYDASGVTVRNALLQLCIDDFQAPSHESNFTVKMNGQDAPFIAEMLNHVDQTGPTAYVVSIIIPSKFLTEVASGRIELVIDETTGIGDGYAIDFAKLLINYKDSVFTGKFSGTTEPGATVRLLGTSTTVQASATGGFEFKAVPGLNAVRASKAGFVENYDYGIVLSSGTEWEAYVPLCEGQGHADIDFSQFNVTEAWGKTSAWAEQYMQDADNLGLIPTCLVGADMTQKIARQEFAALAVKVYEKMSGNAGTQPGAAFADCTDTEVLKAVAIGITNGTNVEKNLFSPSANITREQCAAMLARAYKATAFDGWTLGADSSFNDQFKASFTMPAKFADDSKISAYAKDSVYFMVANNIINGVGNNMFAPVADTTKGAAYGMATREAAIKIAVEMVKNL